MRITKTVRQNAMKTACGFALALTLGATNVSIAASLDEIKASGTLKVVTEDAFPPFEFITDGKPDGFHKDVIEELRAYASFEVTQEQLPWTGLLAAVSAGKYDAAITGAGITEERLAKFDYVAPISLNVSYYIKRAGDDRIQSVRDLTGLKGGVQAGSAVLATIPQLEGILAAMGGNIGEVVEYQSYPEVYADLANGRLDYAVNSVISAAEAVSKRPDVFELGEPTAGLGFIAWPIKKGNDDLLEYLTGFVAHMRDTGKLSELQIKWFGTSFDDLPTESIKSVEQFRSIVGN